MKNPVDLFGISVEVTRSDNVSQIAEAFRKILGEAHGCYFFKPVDVLPYSVRIFCAHLLSDTFQIENVVFLDELSQKLLDFSDEARYDPPENPDRKKGWEIRKAVVNGKPIAIVLAEWV